MPIHYGIMPDGSHGRAFERAHVSPDEETCASQLFINSNNNKMAMYYGNSPNGSDAKEFEGMHVSPDGETWSSHAFQIFPSQNFDDLIGCRPSQPKRRGKSHGGKGGARESRWAQKFKAKLAAKNQKS